MPPLRERREEIPPLVEFFLVEVRGGLPPAAGAAEPRRCCDALLELPVAGQHPRAREHDEALRRAAGRIAGARRARPPAAGGRRGASRRCGRSAVHAGSGGDGRRRRHAGADAGGAAAAACRRRAARAARPLRPTPTTSWSTTRRRGRRRRPAGARAQRGDEGRARGHRSGAGQVPLEPPQGRRLPEGQLQDAAQQDEGVRHLASPARHKGLAAPKHAERAKAGDLERLLHLSVVSTRGRASTPTEETGVPHMADITTLRDAFLDEIRDIYHAEKQLLKALPKLAKAATDAELRSALENHLAETENQVSRLEQVFELVGEKPETKTCAGMAGIIEEGSDVLGEDAGRRPRRADHRLGAAGRALRDRRLRHRRGLGRRPRLHRRGGAAAGNAGRREGRRRDAHRPCRGRHQRGRGGGETPAAGRARAAGRSEHPLVGCMWSIDDGARAGAVVTHAQRFSGAHVAEATWTRNPSATSCVEQQRDTCPDRRSRSGTPAASVSRRHGISCTRRGSAGSAATSPTDVPSFGSPWALDRISRHVSASSQTRFRDTWVQVVRQRGRRGRAARQ